MKGFSGFGNSPLKKADATLVEIAGTADDEAYETIDKMNENMAEHIASVGNYAKKDSTKKPPKFNWQQTVTEKMDSSCYTTIYAHLLGHLGLSQYSHPRKGGTTSKTSKQTIGYTY